MSLARSLVFMIQSREIVNVNDGKLIISNFIAALDVHFRWLGMKIV